MVVGGDRFAVAPGSGRRGNDGPAAAPDFQTGVLSMLFSWLRTRLDKRRNIFSFWDGQRVRRVDPLRVLQTLQADKEFLMDRHIKMAMELGDQEAIAITCKAVQTAFGVSAWSDDQPGLTIAETLALVQAFVGWLELQKKSTEDWPTSIARTPPESTTDESVMNSGSACI
jgi:hypothetical protein